MFTFRIGIRQWVFVLCFLFCCNMRSCDHFIAIIKNFIFIHKTDFIIVEKVYNITFPLDLLMKNFLMMSWYQFFHTSMFKRDPFHIIVRKKNFMKWGVVVQHNNWRFIGRNSYLLEMLKYLNFLYMEISSKRRILI